MRTAECCPNRPEKARDLCAFHYNREWRDRERRFPGEAIGMTPSRILDALELGAATEEALAHELGVKPNTVHVSLYRLRKRGLVEPRRLDTHTVWRLA